jgi:hypothetical protein
MRDTVQVPMVTVAAAVKTRRDHGAIREASTRIVCMNSIDYETINHARDTLVRGAVSVVLFFFQKKNVKYFFLKQKRRQKSDRLPDTVPV